jgi:Protein of unknown function (DUF4054)
VDQPSFFARYPEFVARGFGSNAALVGAVLAEAAVQLSRPVWGPLYDAGHGLLTAHLLAISPFGQQARMAAKDGVTTYWRRYQQLVEMVACGGAVAGGGCGPWPGSPLGSGYGWRGAWGGGYPWA